MPFLSYIDFERVAAYLRNVEDGNAELQEVSKLMADATAAAASPGLADLAREIHGSDEIEIDDEGAGTSPADDGTWVQAWVWVDRAALIDAGLEDPDEEEDDGEES